MRRLAMTGEMFVVAVSAFDESAGRVTFACVPKRSYGPDRDTLTGTISPRVAMPSKTVKPSTSGASR